MFIVSMVVFFLCQPIKPIQQEYQPAWSLLKRPEFFKWQNVLRLRFDFFCWSCILALNYIHVLFDSYMHQYKQFNHLYNCLDRILFQMPRNKHGTALTLKIRQIHPRSVSLVYFYLADFWLNWLNSLYWLTLMWMWMQIIFFLWYWKCNNVQWGFGLNDWRMHIWFQNKKWRIQHMIRSDIIKMFTPSILDGGTSLVVFTEN